MTKLFIKNGDNFEEVDGVLQSEFDDTLDKQLARERSKYSDYEDLKAKAASADTLKSEYEDKLKTANAELTTTKSELGKARLETDRVKIIGKYNISEDLQDFVTGDTAEDMEKRAEKLAKGMVGSNKVPVNKSEKPTKKESGSAKMVNELFGRKSDD